MNLTSLTLGSFHQCNYQRGRVRVNYFLNLPQVWVTSTAYRGTPVGLDWPWWCWMIGWSSITYGWRDQCWRDCHRGCMWGLGSSRIIAFFSTCPLISLYWSIQEDLGSFTHMMFHIVGPITVIEKPTKISFAISVSWIHHQHLTFEGKIIFFSSIEQTNN